MIKNILKEFFKKFNVRTVLDKKRNFCKIFHSTGKLIASDLDIDKAFISMYQSIMTKLKSYACEYWIVLDVIIKHSIKIFEC